MVKFGIIADTHFISNTDPISVKNFLDQLKKAFRDVDEIIHAGDVCENFFLKELKKIAPTKCVRGNEDRIENLPDFIKFTVGKYNIGVIHQEPDNLEVFFKEKNLNILIIGHSHQPLIKGTAYNTLIINPGSPTRPVAPPQKRGFDKPIARPSVITLNIDKEGILTTFLINLNV
ncbi:MAG: metallophosphoesterase family protein [Promethearchaeota archaeon]